MLTKFKAIRGYNDVIKKKGSYKALGICEIILTNYGSFATYYSLRLSNCTTTRHCFNTYKLEILFPQLDS